MVTATFDPNASFVVGGDDGDYTPIAAGLYEAVIVSIEADVSPFDEKDQFKIRFKINDPDSDEHGREISKWVTRFTNDNGSLALPERATITKIVQAVLNGGKPLDEGTRFSIKDLTNKPVLIDIEEYINKKGNEASKIVAVKPVRQSRRAASTNRTSRNVDPDDLPFD